LKLGNFKSRFFQMLLLIIIVVSFTSGSFVFNGKASPTSTYYYRFTVDREGFTTVKINFNSTDTQGASWVFVPNSADWVNTTLSGQITEYKITGTKEVANVDYYFYRALQFKFRSTGGLFSMNIVFNMSTGALIIEPRGIFYSPQIGFQSDSAGTAEVFFYSGFNVNSNKAIVIGATRNYPATQVLSNRVVFNLSENIVRIQVELSIASAAPEFTTLKSSDNKTFTFKSVTRYQTYAQSVLKLYDLIYKNLTRLFNVTLDNVVVQFFLPDFDTLLTVGGFVPFTGGQLGEININIVFIRAVNGTVEIIATHELIHRFIGKTGISPSDFLWFHEGMAQYLSVIYVMSLGYEGAEQEKNNLENGATQLIQNLNGENFDSISLQNWNPSYQPPNVDISSLYVASHYVVSRLPEIAHREGFDYYSRFFKLIQGVKVDDINVLALYLSTAANASVALTLKRWGFTVADLYNSPVNQMIQEAGKAIEEVNPVFQPYRSLAEYFYQQGLVSAEQGDWERTKSLLQLAVTMANLAPLLTFLTIIAMLALLVYILARRSKRPRPIVPPPPPEILQPAA